MIDKRFIELKGFRENVTNEFKKTITNGIELDFEKPFLYEYYNDNDNDKQGLQETLYIMGKNGKCYRMNLMHNTNNIKIQLLTNEQYPTSEIQNIKN